MEGREKKRGVAPGPCSQLGWCALSLSLSVKMPYRPCAVPVSRYFKGTTDVGRGVRGELWRSAAVAVVVSSGSRL
jgi:hypothetical protein